MTKILIIEDDATINGLLRNILQTNGYEADSAHEGKEGLNKAEQIDYSLILLDLMLPKVSGEEIIEKLRKKKNIPVIVLSAKNETKNKIELLRLGADYYITKPFDIDEVLLRIQAVLRRTGQRQDKELSFKEMKIDTEAKRVFVRGSEVICTATEYAILKLMVENSTKIFSKRNLFESVTGEVYYSDENTMNVHISNLRRKIADITPDKYIDTVYGMGYRLSS